MKQNILTKEIVEQFAAGKIDSLNEYTSINAAAAKSLTSFRGNLYLNGLTSLTDEAAKSLGLFKDTVLSLNGLTSLTDKAAKSLASFRGYHLYLNGLTSLTDEAAKALASFKGGLLYLNGLTNLTDGAAKALASFKGDDLYLNGLTNVTDETTKSLASFKGRSLYLNGLTSLTDKAAQALAFFKGGLLYLNGLTSLTDEAAKALASFKGDALYLNGLTSLTDEAAKSPSSIKQDSLALVGITSLTDEASQKCGKNNLKTRINTHPSLLKKNAAIKAFLEKNKTFLKKQIRELIVPNKPFIDTINDEIAELTEDELEVTPTLSSIATNDALQHITNKPLAISLSLPLPASAFNEDKTLRFCEEVSAALRKATNCKAELFINIESLLGGDDEELYKFLSRECKDSGIFYAAETWIGIAPLGATLISSQDSDLAIGNTKWDDFRSAGICVSAFLNSLNRDCLSIILAADREEFTYAFFPSFEEAQAFLDSMK